MEGYGDQGTRKEYIIKMADGAKGPYKGIPGSSRCISRNNDLLVLRPLEKEDLC
jgi:hypothetical protein